MCICVTDYQSNVFISKPFIQRCKFIITMNQGYSKILSFVLGNNLFYHFHSSLVHSWHYCTAMYQSNVLWDGGEIAIIIYKHYINIQVYFAVCIHDFLQYVCNNIWLFHFVLALCVCVCVCVFPFRAEILAPLILLPIHVPAVILACSKYVIINCICKVNITWEI